MSDFLIINHGSVITLIPLTENAKAWVEENLPDDALRLGKSIAMEPRYAPDIVDGIIDDGLRIAA